MSVRIAVLTDFHFSTAPIVPDIPPFLGPVFLERALRRITMHMKPDAVVVLGDIVQDSTEAETQDHLKTAAGLLEMLDCPWFVLPGNHDPKESDFYKNINEPPDFIDIGDVRIVPFSDVQAEQWMGTRSRADIERMKHHRANFSGTIVTCHHVPLFPPGSNDCPFNYTNADDLTDIMQSGGRWLTVGGHHHQGIPVFSDRGVSCTAAPSLWDSPHQFMEITIDGSDISTTFHQLKLPDGLDLVDTHIHSQFAYCSRDSSIEMTRSVADAMGLSGYVITEHSGQLYYDEGTYWSGEPMRIGLDGKEGWQPRIKEYIASLDAVGLPKWSRGLELDCDFKGRPMAEPELLEQMGTLLGSTHSVPSVLEKRADVDTITDELMVLLPKYLASGIDIFAHPFRIFNRVGKEPPGQLFPFIVNLLKKHDVAAELNFHWQKPKTVFVEQCIEAGVKLALGSDAHWLWEIGELSRHLELLEELGCMDHLDDILFDPRK